MVAAMKALLVRELHFEAAHRLPHVPPGHKCARMHGHSYKVELSVSGIVNPETGWLIDFAEIDRVWTPVHQLLDHNCLNDIAGLENPTSENLARWLWDCIRPQLPGLTRVTVYEIADARCEYEGAAG